MQEKQLKTEKDLVAQAIEWLSTVLPPAWSVQRSNRAYSGGNLTEPQTLGDSAIDLLGENVSATLVVEAKRSFSPRDVEPTFGRNLPRVLRTLTYSIPILVVSEWLSPRTRELLEEQEINYLDLTGNALIRLDNPVVYVRSMGASRAPKPATRGQVGLRGAKAARILRLLTDVHPPYGVREIAEASGVVVSWVSKLLDSLDREALLERSARGRVESVDVPRLLRRWAGVYDVFKTNQVTTFLAPRGVSQVLEGMKTVASAGRLAITGSFAAIRLAPIAAPALVVVYTDDVESVSRELGLLPADEGANVALLRPYDSVVWDRNASEDKLRYVAPSQVAIDCLTGNGRMPAEGEALIEWMVANESRWRLDSLASLSSGAATS
ncbi:MAG: helix-turn-helix domain-containing protein [Actinomycetota bacterium]